MPLPTAPSVELHVLAGEYVIARLPPASEVPAALMSAADGFISVTRTPQELSIVCPAALAPADAEIDGTWAAFYASGPIPFGLTGVVASLVAPLAAAGCPVFVVSTFDGDVLMVPSPQYEQALALLRAAGHTLPGV
ncbi:ACT domain-containing protein [Arthrobacter sp. zg-Y238]|uniref:ACT domain-containing protein n=1 Tax=Arthrobacter sp. zg-Y238 TaxID=2964614 RepID=UPI0021040A8E|nr:ACT domain-containing protein [Arthrobacter sp. zg-Y238]MCQ1954038.1 ACT domain-containing protein [Arthrobacter sp. zg-Y238]